MEKINYQIKLKSDTKISAYKFFDPIEERNQIFVTPIAIKYHLIKQLKEVYPEPKIFSKLEEEMFGYLDLNRGAQRGSIQLSYVTCEIFNIPDSKENGKIAILQKGSILKGEIHSLLPTDSKESLALRVVLLTLDRIGDSTENQYGRIELTLDDSLISTEKLYSISQSSLEKMNFVLKYIHKEFQNYYSKNPEIIKELSPRKFEKLVASIFINQGFDVQLTKQTRDNGFDIFAIRNSKILGKEKYLVECKKYREDRKIGIDIIRNVLGVINIEKATKGVIVTTSSFSSESKNLMPKFNSQIHLIDFERLKQIMKE